MSGIAIFGITGRMGQTLVRALREHDPAQPLRLVGAVGSPRSSRLGSDAAVDGAPTGVLVTADLRAALRDAAVAVDFSLPQCVGDNARACMAARVPLLVGATGFDGATREVLKAAAAVIPVLVAPNTSVGVNLVARLVKLATRALGPGYDVEISEAHHRTKRDAPSGTALALGEVVAAERGRKLADVAIFDRHGSDAPRGAGDIGFTVLRAGDIVGEHTVTFAIAGERVEITHRATDRVTFAHGALRAAAWLPGRPPGLYAMDDVLGLDQPGNLSDYST
jgi:4-hydroxy-tetrahydrodipicolinate reductase